MKIFRRENRLSWILTAIMFIIALAAFPFWVSSILSGVPGTAITAVVLSLILREDKDEREEAANQ